MSYREDYYFRQAEMTEDLHIRVTLLGFCAQCWPNDVVSLINDVRDRFGADVGDSVFGFAVNWANRDDIALSEELAGADDLVVGAERLKAFLVRRGLRLTHEQAIYLTVAADEMAGVTRYVPTYWMVYRTLKKLIK